MKKTILILTVLILTNTAKAQITKGNWMFGGDAIIQGYKFENQKEFKYHAEIFPKVGYFVKDQFVIGCEIGIFINEATFYSSLVPFARYYLFNSEKTVNPFVEAGLGLKHISFTSTNITNNEFMSQIKIGTSLFLTNSIALNFTLNYKKNSFRFDQELTIALGFQIHLQKK